MSIEYSAGRRGTGVFPRHWRGIEPGQDAELRAAVLIMNMALDLEARGDYRGAEELRQGYITGRGTGQDSERTAQQRWIENPTAANALNYARSVAGR